MLMNMKKLIVDRYEGQYTVCEDAEQKYFAIETSEMPEGAVPGAVLVISDDGVISVDLQATEERRKKINEKQRSIVQ